MKSSFNQFLTFKYILRLKNIKMLNGSTPVAIRSSQYELNLIYTGSSIIDVVQYSYTPFKEISLSCKNLGSFMMTEVVITNITYLYGD